MKKWRTMVVFVLMVAMCAVGVGCPVYAAPKESGAVQASGSARVFDMADLFDFEEEVQLAAKIDELQNMMDMGLAIVTTEDNSGTASDYADEFYEFYEIGMGEDYDGALFLIDMENGELWISTEGKMVRYLTDERIDAILDDAFEYAYDGYFYDSANAFLTNLEIFYDAGIQSDQYNYDTETGAVDRYKAIQWYEFLIAFAIAAVVAGGAVFAVVHEYGMKNDAARMSANFRLSYRKDSAFTLGSVLGDVLLNSYVSRAVIRAQSSNRPGGGGGRSSSGRSSTHRSSSGRSHGGGGRKFR